MTHGNYNNLAAKNNPEIYIKQQCQLNTTKSRGR